MFRLDATQTRDVLQSPLLWAALGGLYCAALYHAWSSSLQAQVIAVFDASTKTLDMNAFAALFKDKMSALLIWIHLMVVDLLHAREVLLDGDRCGVFTGHSVVLCLFFGPIGLLSHLATKALTGLVRRMSSS